ncbi:MAG: hypothetical protein GWP10_14045 [Nitrospiraceae bacterium]|nr:hypothetical protein [Nitrospiraceae bacterium]
MESIVKFAFKNTRYKLLAIVFAILLWLLASNKETIESKVNLKAIPMATGNYIVLNYHPRMFTLTVEGYRKDVALLNDEGYVKLMLPKELKITNGTSIVKLSTDELILPNRETGLVKVKRIRPKRITVEVEKLIKKVVPIKLEAYGVDPNFKLILSPNYSIVNVPEDKKKSIRFVKTEKIDLSGIRGNAEIYLNVVSQYKVEPDRVKLIIRKR